jgi:hypothetical protein
VISDRFERILKSLRTRQERARKIDRGLGRYAEKLSHVIWPWRESILLILMFAAAILDFSSTYLVLSVKNNASESGRLALWALDRGGYIFLLVLDLAVASLLATIALVLRSFYTRIGSQDYGRAAFVLVLLPYAVIAAAAVVNNTLFLFRG